MATIRTSGLPANFRVKPQVQAFADAVEKAMGLNSFGTYAGHEPTADLAVDIFVPVNDPAPGIRVTDFAGAPPFGRSGPPGPNWDRSAIDYVIFRQHIYNPEISHDWRLMADRGGITQNHFDHVHVSFVATTPQEDDMTIDELRAVLEEKDGVIQSIRTTNTNVNNNYNALKAELDELKAEIAQLKK